MNKKIIVILMVLIITVILSSCANNTKQESEATKQIQENQKSTTQQDSEVNEMKKLTITSSAFNYNHKIPSKYTCDGVNVNPPLKIEGIPSETKSLVLIMDDPDTIKLVGKVWDHWLIFNIPPKVAEIHEHEEPEGMHGKGTKGNTEYYGPCPPDTEHRYFFKIYALDSMLELPEGSAKAEIEKAMKDHILAQGELIGLYERKK